LTSVSNINYNHTTNLPIRCTLVVNISMPKQSILIADNSKSTIDDLKTCLQSLDVGFHEAENGTVAIDRALTSQPDLILLDAAIPETNGFQVLKVLRANSITERTPIIMITSLDSQKHKLQALELGVSGFISKPLDGEELFVRCKSLLNYSFLNQKYILATQNMNTGLPNKQALFEELKKLTGTRIFLIKINNFNDLKVFYGEEIGKLLQKQFSLRIEHFSKNNLVPATKCFHVEEDVFAILVIDQEEFLDVHKSEQFCKGLRDDVAFLPVREICADLDLISTMSFSFAAVNAFERAQLALNWAAKMNYHIIFADDVISDIYKESEKNVMCLQELKAMVEKDRVIPYFQGIYNNSTGKIEKYEALCRLINEDDIAVPAYMFITVLKQSSFYFDVSKLMLEKTFNTFKNRTEDVSLNISSLDITDAEMYSYIIKSLKEYPSVAGRVIFEILESEEFDNYDILYDFIQEVKLLGARIAIDDFGSGYSNFSRILEMKPEILKIDGSFIQNLHNDTRSQNIVKSIKMFASKMGMELVAEFVSNEQIFSMVKKLGINYSQGFYLSKPSPL